MSKKSKVFWRNIAIMTSMFAPLVPLELGYHTDIGGFAYWLLTVFAWMWTGIVAYANLR